MSFRCWLQGLIQLPGTSLGRGMESEDRPGTQADMVGDGEGQLPAGCPSVRKIFCGSSILADPCSSALAQALMRPAARKAIETAVASLQV